MAQLPKPIDYSGRPSLRSSRVDTPPAGELASGEALANAVSTFNQVLNDRKGKQDKLNYALARNELQQADLAAREALKDDEDWGTYDQRYSESYGTARDEIMGRYQLAPADRAILGSESGLILERGRVQVGDAARIVEIDEGMSRLNNGLTRARESIAVELDPETRNQVIIGQLDAINAAEEKSWITDVEAEKRRRNFAADAADASLTNMNAEDREELLRASLKWRKSNGAITEEMIREGKGSGSIADFLPADVVRKMLDITEDENKITQNRGRAQGVVDEAFDLYPESAKERDAYIRKQTNDDPDVRALAESMATTRNAAQHNYDVQERNEVMREYGSELESDPTFTYHDIPPEELAKLLPGQKNQLEEYGKKLRNNQGFADVNNWHVEERETTLGPVEVKGEIIRPSYSTWADMSQGEKLEQDLDLLMWKNNFTQGMWKAFQDEQDQIKNGKAPAEDNVQTNDQILQSTVVGMGMFAATGRTDAKNAAYQRLRARFADDVRLLQAKEYGGQKAPFEVRKNALLLILAEQAWQRDKGWFGFDATDPEQMFGMTPAEVKAGFIPIHIVKEQMTSVEIGGVDVPMTWEERLKNKASSELDGRVPTQKDIENAFFAIRAKMTEAEVLRRLAGKGDY